MSGIMQSIKQSIEQTPTQIKLKSLQERLIRCIGENAEAAPIISPYIPSWRYAAWMRYNQTKANSSFNDISMMMGIDRFFISHDSLTNSQAEIYYFGPNKLVHNIFLNQEVNEESLTTLEMEVMFGDPKFYAYERPTLCTTEEYVLEGVKIIRDELNKGNKVTYLYYENGNEITNEKFF